MSDATTKQLSADDLAADDDIRTEDVPIGRGFVKIGSVCSADIVEWIEENEDKVKGRFAGLRLLAKSIINPDGTRIPEDQRDDYVERLKTQDNMRNGKLVDAALRINGVIGRGAAPKNDSGATAGDGSPSASASPQDGTTAPTTSSAV